LDASSLCLRSSVPLGSFDFGRALCFLLGDGVTDLPNGLLGLVLNCAGLFCSRGGVACCDSGFVGSARRLRTGRGGTRAVSVAAGFVNPAQQGV
jgi:hypothetical protein